MTLMIIAGVIVAAPAYAGANVFGAWLIRPLRRRTGLRPWTEDVDWFFGSPEGWS